LVRGEAVIHLVFSCGPCHRVTRGGSVLEPPAGGRNPGKGLRHFSMKASPLRPAAECACWTSDDIVHEVTRRMLTKYQKMFHFTKSRLKPTGPCFPRTPCSCAAFLGSPSLERIGHSWSYLTCIIGCLVHMWQPCTGSSFLCCLSWVTIAGANGMQVGPIWYAELDVWSLFGSH
jgi:hypothetical protein